VKSAPQRSKIVENLVEGKMNLLNVFNSILLGQIRSRSPSLYWWSGKTPWASVPHLVVVIATADASIAATQMEVIRFPVGYRTSWVCLELSRSG